MSLLLALDNCALVRLLNDAGLMERFERAVEVSSATLLLPAPAMAELLAFDPDAERRRIVADDFAYGGRVPSFSEASATIFADLHARHWSTRPPESGRQAFKVDLMIAACAVEQRCDALVSEDVGARKALGGTSVHGWTLEQAIDAMSPESAPPSIPAGQGSLL